MQYQSRRAAFQEARPWQPLGTYGLLGVMVFVFILEQVILGRSSELFHTLFLIDADWASRPWSLITSTLAHGSVMHILFNGLVLFFFGPTLEGILGTRRFVLLFLIAGAIAGIAQVALEALVSGDAHNPALGASGALMMVFGTLMVLMPKEKVLIYGIVPLPFWLAGIGYAALDVLGAFNPADGIGNFAHLSGMALGLGLGVYLKGAMRAQGLRLAHA